MSDILNAMQKQNEPKRKVIVNHTGSCEGYHFVKDTEVELPESIVAALGSDARIIGQVEQPQQPVQPEEPKQPEKPEEPEDAEQKDVKQPPVNKMIGEEETLTK